MIESQSSEVGKGGPEERRYEEFVIDAFGSFYTHKGVEETAGWCDNQRNAGSL